MGFFLAILKFCATNHMFKYLRNCVEIGISILDQTIRYIMRGQYSENYNLGFSW